VILCILIALVFVVVIWMQAVHIWDLEQRCASIERRYSVLQRDIEDLEEGDDEWQS
jgi:hypothetical protein